MNRASQSTPAPFFTPAIAGMTAAGTSRPKSLAPRATPSVMTSAASRLAVISMRWKCGSRVDDTLLIDAIEASIDAAPHRVCPSVTPNFQRLVGLRIQAGFLAEARRRLGGASGCTHLVELLGPLATEAIQTVVPMRLAAAGRRAAERPSQIGSCHALALSGEVVAKYWPSFSPAQH